ncbi:hypothetical protein KUK83_003265 [Vibrio parahaemolyticus]|nr:hypothetical protein [Vibrio parahaemolyticus]EHR6925430.1 hypothetical protein [Vibrio parahaemolyticus]EJG0303415.1 hypothetical protein [Vibrio parahaemolyticus]EJG0516862.1 hypothetical protein [Vibrio parahaemolyticus]EJG1536679.1 hypothetical protein [Vibrio parahaemolyticus]
MQFLELVFKSADFIFEGRDVIEDALDETLSKIGLGEVTGGGSGLGYINIDIEVNSIELGLPVIRKALVSLGVAPSTVINCYYPERVEYKVYE